MTTSKSNGSAQLHAIYRQPDNDNGSGSQEPLAVANQYNVDQATSVKFFLEPLQEFLQDPDITEVCVNRPGEVFCERKSQWEQWEAVPGLEYEWLEDFARAIATFTYQEISQAKPILSAVLPHGERIQIVFPPACERETISVTIRKPSRSIIELTRFEDQGFFGKIKPLHDGLTEDEKELQHLLSEKLYLPFLKRAVREKKVIIIAGETGSGKTTFMKSLMQEVSPDERIITIEDVPELFLPHHPNRVHLFYPSEAGDDAPVTSQKLLKSCLRMKPDRIMLAELRGGETFDFINIAASGHGGSITSCHAGSCDLTFERLALMVLMNRQGRTLPYEVIKRLLYLTVDVVVHIHNDTSAGGLGRHITEIYFDPARKREMNAGVCR